MARYIFCFLRCSNGWLAGDLLDSETYGRLALNLAREMPGLVPMAASYLARTLVDRGLTAEADELLQQGPGPTGTSLHWSVLAHLREAQGRHAEAAEAALKIARAPNTHHGVSCAIPWRLQAAVSLAATGEQSRATVLLTQQRPITERWGLSRPLAALQRAEGLVHNSTEHLTNATATLERTPAPLEQARTLIDLGAMRRRENQRSQARTALRAGLDLAHRCGADRLVTRATEELAACGARPRQLLLTGIDSLTASEWRVARLAAQGKSNPEIAQHPTSRARPSSPTSARSTANSTSTPASSSHTRWKHRAPTSSRFPTHCDPIPGTQTTPPVGSEIDGRGFRKLQ